MAKPTVTVALNADDLYFLTDSIALNVPSEKDMSAAERKTYRKMHRAAARLHRKGS